MPESVNKTCQNCQKDFIIESDDFVFYDKINVPPPTFCPECRLVRRMMWRNERTLYSRKCDLCKENKIGVYASETPYTVYCRECWWGDKWDATELGQEYDFSKSFFEQFKELLFKVPRVNMMGKQNIDSDYANYSLSNKNMYLCFASHYNEDGAYLQYCNKTQNAYDCLHVNSSEFVIDCNYCTHLYRCYGLMYADSCSDCILGYDLRGCTNCFGCVGLRQQAYCIFNQQYDKEEYYKQLALLTKDKNAYNDSLKRYQDLLMLYPRPYTYMRKSTDCEGNDIEESRNVSNSFSVRNSENSKYLFVNCVSVKDSMDLNNAAYDPVELSYESQGMTNSSNVRFVDTSWDNNDIEYANLCFNTQNVFGCIGLRKKEYCILNKQYSKEEYLELLPKIKQHMEEKPYVDNNGYKYSYGEFFPSELSPFTYNESLAMMYSPLSEEEILEKKYRFHPYEKRNYTITLDSVSLPNTVSEYDKGDLTKEIIGCEHAGSCKDNCTTAFRVLEQEVALYKSLSIPLSILCPNCRNMKRLNNRGPFKLWKRSCMCNNINHDHGNDRCKEVFQTSYSSERPEIVYCEMCYKKEIA